MLQTCQIANPDNLPAMTSGMGPIGGLSMPQAGQAANHMGLDLADINASFTG